jgi:sugar phosphate isomerase/epimerase
MTRVGLMLYTVREDCDRDLEGTLGEVAAIGYEGVELFGLHGHTPEQVRRMLDTLGLAACGRHIPLGALDGGLPALADEARTLGHGRVIVGWVEPPSTPEAARALAERIGAGAALAATLGLELGFHNHDAEVRDLGDGSTVLDALLAQPLFLEVDLGWAWWAGVDPVHVLDSARGRVPLVHVKDFRVRGERAFCPVGDGSVDFERIVPAAVAQGVEWLLVEQDEAAGSALDAARRSYGALTSILERA